MMKRISNTLLAAILVLFPTLSPAEEIVTAEQADLYSGYYSRDGNDDLAAKTTGNSIYLKFYPDKWVAMLYVPYPYSLTLEPSTLNEAFKEVKRQTRSSAYFKSKFGVLAKKATAHVETYEMLEVNKAIFECDGTAPCRTIFNGDSMDMIKAGMLNNHIIRFNRIVEP